MHLKKLLHKPPVWVVEPLHTKFSLSRANGARDADVWNGARALFLSVPYQAKKRDETRRGRMTTRTLSYVVEKIASRADVGHVHPHRFRHHVGYLMNERGGITAVQKQLGHRNIAYSAMYCQRTDDEMAGYLE